MKTQTTWLNASDSTPPPGFYKGKPRPYFIDDDVFSSSVDKLLPSVMKWGGFPENEIEEVRNDLLFALMTGDPESLEARAARHDTGMEELLEGADYSGCYERAVKAWIKDNNIVPALPVGQQVKIKDQQHTEMLDGKICSISDHGKYCVMVPAMGHVESGLGTHGIMIPWEEVEKWNSGVTEAGNH